jgi:hypothetical protein
VHTTIGDDEENMKPSQLGASGRKTPAGSVGGESSSVTPVPARVPDPQQATTTIQEPHERDFKELFPDIRAHVNDQVDSDGLPVICSNAKLERSLKGLEIAASRNNAYVFRSMRDMIDEELANVGLPTLPDV